MNIFSNTKKALIAAAILAVSIGGSFLFGMEVGSEYGSTALGSAVFARTTTVQPEGVDFTPLWKVWNTIDEKYVPTSTSTPLTDDEKLWGAIQGLAKSTGDPYTVFFPPVEAEMFAADISGNFEGVGMEIGMRNGLLTVIAPLEGTPAKRAGIQSGDIVLKIDETFTDGMTIDESVQLIRGEGGTTVNLLVSREGEGEFLEIPIVRDVIQIPTIKTELRDDGIFTIALYNFSAPSTNLFRTALREFVESGSNKLILDLRGNPGGFLSASVDMASFFLPAQEVVVRESYGEGEKERVHRSSGKNIFNDSLEMVILLNRGSASASEILAGALSQHGIATLVGEKSFGKGSVQELVDVTKETSFKVTIARWLTPNGTSISHNGLEPDVAVEVTKEDIEAGIDPVMEAGVDLLLGTSCLACK